MSEIMQVNVAQAQAILRASFAIKPGNPGPDGNPYPVPIMFVSGPGQGKSTLVEQAAADAARHLFTSHPATEDPTDSKGMPWIEAGRADFVPFETMRQLQTIDRPAVWFTDDFGQAGAAVQAPYMQWFLNRAVNGHRLSDYVAIVIATNRRIDKSGVSSILEAVKGRVIIVEIVPDVDLWCRWAMRPDSTIDPRVIAWVRQFPVVLSDYQPTNELENTCTPRTIARASYVLGLKLDHACERAMLAGAIGPGRGSELAAYLRMVDQMPSLDRILIDPMAVDLPTDPSILYAVCAGLAYRVNTGNVGRITMFAQRLLDNGSGEFAVLLVRDCLNRDPSVARTADMIKLYTSDFGKLLKGEV